MANNYKKKMTLELEMDVGKAPKQIESLSKRLKDMVGSIETASDKFEVFKNLAEYLKVIDTRLAELKSIDVNLFEQIFGVNGNNVDSAIKKALEPLTKTPENVAKAMADIQTRINDALTAGNGNGAGGTKNLRKIAEDINSVYITLGKEPPIDLGVFSGRVDTKGFESRISLLTNSISDLKIEWGELIADIKQSDGAISGVKKLSDAVQKEFDEIAEEQKKLQETLDALNGKTIFIKTDKKNDFSMFNNLIGEYRELSQAIEEMEARGEKSSGKYKKAVLEQIRLASLVKGTYEYLCENGSSKAFGYIGEENTIKEILRIDDFLDNYKKKHSKIVSSAFNDIQYTMYGNELRMRQLQNENATVTYKEIEENVLRLKKAIDSGVNAEEIKDSILELKLLSEDAYDEINDILYMFIGGEISSATDVIQKLCAIFGTEIPSSVAKASSAFGKVTTEVKRVDDAATKVMYHVGNLLNGKGSARDDFSQMFENLTMAPEGTVWENYGFGVLGGGLFGVSNPNIIGENTVKGTNFIHSIDLSKYNMYIANTEDRALNLIDFLSKLQKFSLKSAVPEYSGFDEALSNASLDTLYTQFLSVFDSVDFTKTQFKEFLDEMQNLLSQAGTKLDEATGEIIFENENSELMSSDNISTRLLKKLGYEGVNVSGTSLDTFGQGSVVFDFKDDSIIGFFSEVSRAIEDYNSTVSKLPTDAIENSIEILKTYKQNALDLIDKLEQKKTSNNGLIDVESIDITIKRLQEYSNQIDEILNKQNKVGGPGDGSTTVDGFGYGSNGGSSGHSSTSKVEIDFSNLENTLKSEINDLKTTVDTNANSIINSLSSESQKIVESINNIVDNIKPIGDNVSTIKDKLVNTNDNQSDEKQDVDEADSEKNITKEFVSTELQKVITSIGGITDSIEPIDSGVKSIDENTKAIKDGIDKINNHISNTESKNQSTLDAQKIADMKSVLLQYAKVVKEHSDQEISGQLLTSGQMSVGYGEDHFVPWDSAIMSQLSDLTSGLLADFHSHPWGRFNASVSNSNEEQKKVRRYANDDFSGAKGDLGAFRTSKRLGAQIAGMITGDIIRIIDLSKVTDEQMSKMRNAMARLQDEYVKKYPQYFGKKKDGSYFFRGQDQGSLENMHQLKQISEQMMNAAFNIAKFPDDVFQKFDIKDEAQLTALATRLVELQEASQNAIAPVDRLAQIIEVFGGKGATETNKGKTALTAYTKGKMSAAEVVRELTGYSVHQDTVDALMRINPESISSPIEQLLAQISGILETIKNSVSSIELNSTKTDTDRLNLFADNIRQLKDGTLDLDKHDFNFSGGKKLSYDEQNVSEYYSKKIATSAIKKASNIAGIITDETARGITETKDLLQIFEDFYSSIKMLQDAIKQVQLYESRTGEELIGENKKRLLYELKGSYSNLTHDKSINNVMSLVASAKDKINDRLSLNGVLDNQTLPIDNISFDTEKIEGQLSSIEGCLEEIKQIVDLIRASQDNINLESFSGNIAKISQDIASIDNAIKGTISATIDSFEPSSITNILGDISANVQNLLGAVQKQDGGGEQDSFRVQNDTNDSNITQNLVSELSLVINNFITEINNVIDRLRVQQQDHIDTGYAKDTGNTDNYNIKDNDAQIRQSISNIFTQIENDLSEVLASYKAKFESISTLTNSSYDLADDLLQLVSRIQYVIENLKQDIIGLSGIDTNVSLNFGDGSANGLESFKDEINEIIESIKKIGTAFNEEKNTIEQVISSEVSLIKELQDAINKVETAIDNKTAAFLNEKGTVEHVVAQEIEELKKLEGYVSNIKSAFETLFSGGNIDSFNGGNITITTEQKENKDYKFALESTLQNTNKILGDILGALSNNTSFDTLIGPLKDAVIELKNVAAGIIHVQKAKKTDTSVANMRIANNDSYQQIKASALLSLGDRATYSQITDMQALENGIVKVIGYIKTAQGEYEKFTVLVNEANQAQKLQFKNDQAFSDKMKALENKKKDDENKKNLSKEDTMSAAEYWFKDYMKSLDSGKEATLQFKDNNSFTIAIKEKVGGLIKETFETYYLTVVDSIEEATKDALGNPINVNGQNIKMSSGRTTATVSNKGLVDIENTNKLINASGVVSDKDQDYVNYTAAYNELERLNELYRNNEELSEEDVNNWIKQINLVKQLGSVVEALIKKKNLGKDQEVTKEINQYAKDRLIELQQAGKEATATVNSAGESIITYVNEVDGLLHTIKEKISDTGDIETTTEKITTPKKKKEKKQTDKKPKEPVVTYSTNEILEQANNRLKNLPKDVQDAKITVKETGDYVVSYVKEVNGVIQKISETFKKDGTIAKSTVTLSNVFDAHQSIYDKLNSSNKDIESYKANGFVDENDTKYIEYQKAYSVLLELFERRDKWQDEDIQKWTAQIQLVKTLGQEVQKIVTANMKKAGIVEDPNAGLKKQMSNKLLDSKQSQLSGIVSGLGFNVNSKNLNQEQSYVANAYNAVKNKIDDIRKSGQLLTEEQRKEINILIAELEKEVAAYSKLQTAKKNAEEAKVFGEKKNDSLTALDDYKKGIKGFQYLTDETKNKFEELRDKMSQVTDINGLIELENEFKSLKDTVSKELETNVSESVEKSKLEIDNLTSSLNNLKKQLDFDVSDSGLQGEQAQIAQKLLETQAKINVLKKNAANATEEEKNAVKELVSELEKVMTSYIQNHPKQSTAKKDTKKENANSDAIAHLYKSTASDLGKKTNNLIRPLNFDLFGDDLNEEQKKIADIFHQLDFAIKQIEKDSGNATDKQVQDAKELHKNLTTLVHDYTLMHSSASKTAFGASNIKSAENKYDKLRFDATTDQYIGSTVVQDALLKYTDTYEKLIKKQQEFVVGENQGTDEFKKKREEFLKLQNEANNYASALSKILREDKNLANKGNSVFSTADFDLSEGSGRRDALISAAQSMSDGSVEVGKFKKNFTELNYTVKNADGTFTDFTAKLNASRTAIVSVEGATKEVKGAFASFVDEIKTKGKSIAAYLISMTGFQEVWQQIRQGIIYVREIDTALTELKKVTDETDASYKQFLQDMAKTSAEIGSTTKDLTLMAAEWGRLGYSMKEAGDLAKSTAILLNVSEFETATEASEALISTIQAFGYAADDSMHVVDILNEVLTCLRM